MNLLGINAGEFFKMKAVNDIRMFDDAIVTAGGDIILGAGNNLDLGSGAGLSSNGGYIGLSASDIIISAAVDAGVWTGTQDCTNIPTEDVYQQWLEYDALRKPDGKADSAARKAYKEAHPLLWAWKDWANAPDIPQSQYLEWYKRLLNNPENSYSLSLEGEQ